MGPPIGTKKVTIIPSGASTIDGEAQIVLEAPYEYVQLLFRGGDWHVIGM